MKSPAIVQLNTSERQKLINELKQSNLHDNNKELMVDTIGFIDELIEELQTSKVSINNLKQLLGFKSEQLKKALQTQ